MASIKFGNYIPQKIYLGSTEVQKIYFGNTQIYGTDDWLAVITEVMGESPELEYNDILTFAEDLCMAYNDSQFDGRGLIYWADVNTPMASYIDNGSETFPSGTSGWTLLGTCDISLSENPADIMATNTTTVYLLVPTSLTTITVYYKVIS